ncbi:MAG: sodium-translocating pyrophosphatase [bacterium]|nr:sodium-translocating pyrophosphatase [bacterium]
MNDLLLWPLYSGGLAIAVVVLLSLDLLKKSRGNATMIEISIAVQVGARAFLRREYTYILWFVLAVSALIAAGGVWKPETGLSWRTAVAFCVGAFGSALAGYVGMSIATRANSRTTEAAREGGVKDALGVAVSGGAVMGLSVVGISLLGLCLVMAVFRGKAQIVNGYAMGASLVALFARSGGGIYTKGADMGADLVGKVEAGIPEDDPRNAATIADNVGDNVGDVAGLGSDLMESYVEAIIAAMAIAASLTLGETSKTEMVMLPMAIAAWGIVCSVLGILSIRLAARSDPQKALMNGTYVAAALMIAGSWLVVKWLGHGFRGGLDETRFEAMGIFYATVAGVVAGGVVGFVSEYYTSHKFRPTRAIAQNSQSGPALTVVEGLSVGMKSCTIPTIILAVAILVAYHYAGFYGIAMAALGMLATTGIIVSVDSYGPIADNAGGIAEMAHLDRSVREITDNLDAVGNTTAAIGKGFAIGSAAFAAVGLLVAYVKTADITTRELALNNPRILAGLLLGGMFPYFFSSMLFKAVSRSAFAMIDEVRKQLREIPGIMEGKARPDYARCVDIATRGAINGMLVPGGVAILLPAVVGFTLGKQMLTGVLIGALVSGLMIGIQMANSGGAMDNAKKFIEEGNYGGKGSDAHKAAVVGDTVGDPLKDTVGPSINILIKLMCVISLVIAPLLA